MLCSPMLCCFVLVLKNVDHSFAQNGRVRVVSWFFDQQHQGTVLQDVQFVALKIFGNLNDFKQF